MSHTHRDREWMRDASCTLYDPELWFTGATDRGATTDAQRICKRCTVRTQCHTYVQAIEPDDQRRYGIWAGLTPGQRTRQARAA